MVIDSRSSSRESLGYRVVNLGSFIDETRHIAGMHAAIALHLEQNMPIAPACILSGGETTVTLCRARVGAAIREFVLAALTNLEQTANVTVLSGGTDGEDGPTDAAGQLRTRQPGGAASLSLDAANFFNT